MRILVLGSKGMLGHKMVERLQLHFSDVIGLSRADFDAEDASSIRSVMLKHSPSVVVNCVGIVKQRKEELDESIAVNALFPHVLQGLCLDQGAYLVHFSTDCVFSGQKGNYSEHDECDVKDLYGITKWLGEVKNAPNALTIRTSIIGRERENHLGLLEWFLRQKGTIPGHDRAIFSGVTTNWLAETVPEIIREDRLLGLYQVAAPQISKFNLLKIFQEVYDKRDVDIVKVGYPHCNRSLCGHKFEMATGVKVPNIAWMVAAQKVQDEGKGYDIR